MSAAQTAGGWYEPGYGSPFSDAYRDARDAEPMRFTCSLLDPEDSFPTTPSRHDMNQDDDLELPELRAPPTDLAPPLAERETMPPDPLDDEKATAILSAMLPPPDSMAKQLEDFKIEAREGRGEILTELRIGNHEAKRSNRRLTSLETVADDLQAETARLRRLLRRALRRIRALEKAANLRKAYVPATAPPSSA